MASAMNIPDERKTTKLVVFGRHSAGFLVLPLAEDLSMTVRVRRRHVKLLLALNDLLAKEEHLHEMARGWMTDREIADVYAGSGPVAIPPGPETIAAYRSQIKKLIAQATPAGHSPPQLLLTERSVGVRLTKAITVIDASRQARVD